MKGEHFDGLLGVCARSSVEPQVGNLWYHDSARGLPSTSGSWGSGCAYSHLPWSTEVAEGAWWGLAKKCLGK